MKKNKQSKQSDKEPLEASLGDLMATLRSDAFRSVQNAKFPNLSHSYWLGRIVEHLWKLEKHYVNTQQKVIDDFAVKDKSGQAKVIEIEQHDGTKIKDPLGRADFGDKKKDADKALKALNETKETIPFNKIIITDKDDIPDLTPAQWASVSLFIEIDAKLV